MLWPVSVKAVVIRDGAVLLARNDRDEWELPGGRLEVGEQPAQTVVREVLEETGQHVAPASLIASAVWEVLPGSPVLLIVFRCTLLEEGELLVSEEHSKVQWVSVQALESQPLPRIYAQFIAVALR